MPDFERTSEHFELKISPMIHAQDVKFLICHLPDVYFTGQSVEY